MGTRSNTRLVGAHARRAAPRVPGLERPDRGCSSASSRSLVSSPSWIATIGARRREGGLRPEPNGVALDPRRCDRRDPGRGAAALRRDSDRRHPRTCAAAGRCDPLDAGLLATVTEPFAKHSIRRCRSWTARASPSCDVRASRVCGQSASRDPSDDVVPHDCVPIPSHERRRAPVWSAV
jgi:hypothetical protein